MDEDEKRENKERRKKEKKRGENKEKKKRHAVAVDNINEDIYEVNEVQKFNEDKFMIDIGIQVNFTDNFSQILKTDQQLSTATGIQNFVLLDSIVEAVEIAVPHLKKHGSELSIRDRCLITFIKLKQNLSYTFLCLLFPTVSIRYCSNIIYPIHICDMLDILSVVLEPFIYFPSMDEILKNMPLCFAKYSSIQIILDCTEIKIQKPKNLCCQIATYSNYKGTNTVKFMTGVTPGGLISCVSKAYGGRLSDKAILEQSCLIEKIEKNASIMVDKGFLSDEIWLKDQKKFTKSDAIDCVDIARARVHVEKLNHRLKVFQILDTSMTSCLVPKCEKIMIILSAIVNLSNPKNDKFNC